MLKKVWNWVVYSSENPNKVSMSITGASGFIIVALGWTQYGHVITGDIVNEGLRLTVDWVQSGVKFALASAALFGFGRKVYRLVKPKEA